MAAASLIYEWGRTEILINRLEPDSGKAKNNSPQLNASLCFIHIFILMPLLRPSSSTHNLLWYAYASLEDHAMLMLASLNLHLHVHFRSCFSGV